MTAYYHRHPRDFANECMYFRCADEREEREAEEAGYERIGLRELREHLRWINSENYSMGQRRARGYKITGLATSSELSWTYAPEKVAS